MNNDPFDLSPSAQSQQTHTTFSALSSQQYFTASFAYSISAFD